MQLDLNRAVTVFQSLTDLTRLRILRLFFYESTDLCLCDISEALDEPTYKISRHLKALREAGLLQAEKEGRWLFHRISDDGRADRYLFKFVMAMKDSEGQLKRDQFRIKKICCKKTESRCRGSSKGEA
jgi:ArsR family transcriptional regulator